VRVGPTRAGRHRCFRLKSVGRFILGILVGIVLIIILFAQCTKAIF
jgi:hypothetical protein